MKERIKLGQLVLKIGPFNVRIESGVEAVLDGIDLLYKDYTQLPSDSFSDFYVRIILPSNFRRFWRKQVLFAFDQFQPFKPLPYNQALPFFEWGLNWCVSGYAHQFLVLHAAVVEKKGKALILPGFPGSGKSTLCAALVNSGWRLLSDELTLFDRSTGKVVPIPRPVSLKNESIKIIKQSFSHASFSPTVHDTLKGSVALMKPDPDCINKMDVSVEPKFIVFPAYEEGVQTRLEKSRKAEAFMKLADLSFNYPVLGRLGFEAMGDLIEKCNVFTFQYDGDLNRAIESFDMLALDN